MGVLVEGGASAPASRAAERSARSGTKTGGQVSASRSHTWRQPFVSFIGCRCFCMESQSVFVSAIPCLSRTCIRHPSINFRFTNTWNDPPRHSRQPCKQASAPEEQRWAARTGSRIASFTLPAAPPSHLWGNITRPIHPGGGRPDFVSYSLACLHHGLHAATTYHTMQASWTLHSTVVPVWSWAWRSGMNRMMGSRLRSGHWHTANERVGGAACSCRMSPP